MTDDVELHVQQAKWLFFKDEKSLDLKKLGKKEDKRVKDQSKEEDMLKELIKAQVEAAKRAEEEKKELFQYLRESHNHTQELVLGAIWE